MSAKASYTKLRSGAWGVRLAGGPKPSAGDAVSVTKKNGETKREVIAKVVWSGPGTDGSVIHLCALMPSAPMGGSASRGKCSHCGCDCNPRYGTCKECAHGGQSYVTASGEFVLGSDD